MSEHELKETLRLMVRQHGFKRVNQCLSEVRISEYGFKNSNQKSKLSNRNVVNGVNKVRPKLTAQRYVAKMELSREKARLVKELAERFEDKLFLPSYGDISSFCESFDIKKPASMSRANAIPRIFKFISGLETREIQRLVEERMFSGPSSLGPIADAIRRNGGAVTRANLGDSTGGVS